MELWEQAQAHINSRKRPAKSGETQIFAGLLKCADCGWGLRYMHNNAPLMNELSDKIMVHEAVKDENGNRTQEIEIFYRFVGKID